MNYTIWDDAKYLGLKTFPCDEFIGSTIQSKLRLKICEVKFIDSNLSKMANDSSLQIILTLNIF